MKTKILFIVFLLTSFTFVGISQNPAKKFKVWKTIELGGGNKSDLIEKLKTEFGSEDKKILKCQIKMENKKHSVKLVLISLKQLCYKKDARRIRYDKVCNLAKKQGLKLCPNEVLLRLPFKLNMKDKKNELTSYFIATRVFTEITYLERNIYSINNWNDEIIISRIKLSSDNTAPGGDRSDLFQPYDDNWSIPSFVFML
jgi:hypothetical protein